MPKCTFIIAAKRMAEGLTRLVSVMLLGTVVVTGAKAQFPSTAPALGATGQNASSTDDASGQSSTDPFQVQDPNAMRAGRSATAGQSGGSTTSNGSLGSGGSLSSFGNPGLGTNSNVLSASQIISILQQKPEVVVELKELVSDQLQQRGSDIQADDISDEMLYNQIETNADLRANITMFFRARGYISSDSLQGVAAGDSEDGNGIGTASSSGSVEDLGALAGATGTGFSALNGNAPGFPTRAGATASGRQTADGRRDETVNASTDEPKVLRRPAPYNLQSMRDLYTQIPQQDSKLKRFGSEVFLNRAAAGMARGSAGRDTPLDVPLGPDYIVGPGDTLSINLWGGVTQTFNRAVDRDGRILLPEAGSVDVAGLSLGRVQELIEGALKPQYRNAQISVTVSQLRSVRIYIVGDVQRPGGFDVSALATPLSALYAAGGPTATGSMRTLRHLRGKDVVEEIDLYDFLLHGLRKDSTRFESGDTLLIPPAGPQVAISGAVKRPAIYELNGKDSSLASIVQDAGGFTVAASYSHITVDRIGDNRQRVTVTLGSNATDSGASDQAAITEFKVKDGDRVRVAPVLPYSQRAVYLEGHVVRPGRQSYTEGMQLSNVLRSYQDMLPEAAPRGEIIRLVPPDLHAEAIAFNVPDVLIGNANVELQPFDTVRIYGRYEVDAPKVTIHGEVLRPGTFPLSEGMTAAQLVRLAGGFKSDALLDSADLTSYTVSRGTKVVGSLTPVRIGAAVNGMDHSADIPLKRGDILTIHQITGWNDIGESVQLVGQVTFPGSYGFQEGERLSSVLRRAGGFRETAYPAGAVLVREQVRELEQKSREELIRQIETSSSAARLSPNLGSGDSGATLKLIQAQQDEVLGRLKSEPPTGRLVVHLSADIDSWANTPADIELRKGDVLTIPKTPGFVLVTGQVYNATALTFTPGKTAGWYLQHAGGTSNTANRKEIFVIRANGSVIGRRSNSGWFDASVLSVKLDPGDVVVVPQKVIGASLFWRNLLTTAQLASSIAITAAVASL
jgi:protein involved in polysaccharide export with SLBB domain